MNLFGCNLKIINFKKLSKEFRNPLRCFRLHGLEAGDFLDRLNLFGVDSIEKGDGKIFSVS